MYQSNILFASETVLFSENVVQIGESLNELKQKSGKIDLRINMERQT